MYHATEASDPFPRQVAVPRFDHIRQRASGARAGQGRGGCSPEHDPVSDLQRLPVLVGIEASFQQCCIGNPERKKQPERDDPHARVHATAIDAAMLARAVAR